MAEAELDDAIARAQEATRALLQGSILSMQDACVVLADPDNPMGPDAVAAAGELEDSDGPPYLIVGEPTDEVAVLTQTCDLQNTSALERYCLVAPVLRDQSAELVRQVTKGWKVALAAVPWLDEFSLIDLGRVTTIERHLLVGATELAWPKTDREQFDLSSAITRHFGRIALPDSVVKVLRPITRRMRERHSKNSNEAAAIARVLSARVEANPSFDDPCPDLRVVFVVESLDMPSIESTVEVDRALIDGLRDRGIDAASTAALADPTDAAACRAAWIALAELWTQEARATANSSDDVDSLDVEVLNDTELSFGRSLRAPELDVMYLSRPGDP